MTSSRSRFQQTLKSHGYSVTAPRRKLFAALEHREAQSMAELIAAVGETIDRASVYRTIALFEQLGIVQRLNTGWKYKLELANEFQDHHHHMTCVQCDAILPFQEGQELSQALQQIADSHGFELLGHQLELRGKCRNCSAKQLSL